MSKKYKVRIKGIGSYVPDRSLTNKDLHEMYGTNELWPEQYLGIKERRWVVNELASDLGYKAGLKAVVGDILSGLDVATIIRSMSFIFNPEFSTAFKPAL